MTIEKISRIFFAVALAAIVTALLFSLIHKTNWAEQAGVVTYICMTIGVIFMVIDEMKNQKSPPSVKYSNKRKKKSQR